VGHAVLGAGGIGGFIGGALARAGDDVLVLVRPETLALHPARLRVESVVLGDFEVDITASSALDRDVDVLWVTTKATQLEAALELAAPQSVGDATVVPLLNGVDHVALLRERYRHVLAGAIRVESERVEPGVVREKTRFARVDLAPGRRRDDIADRLRAAGLDVALARNEQTLLWEKLAFLAPLALTTTARGAPVGTVQDEPGWNTRLMRCHDETVAVAIAEGATLDPPKLRRAIAHPGGEMRTSMQKDFDAGRPLELDAIVGPITRGGRARGVSTPATEQLVRFVESRLAARVSSAEPPAPGGA
jgi:2-dehydropantoate 2-reductase